MKPHTRETLTDTQKANLQIPELLNLMENDTITLDQALNLSPVDVQSIQYGESVDVIAKLNKPHKHLT